MKSGFWQLLPHKHTFELHHHRHSSYPGMVLLLVMAGVLLTSVSLTAEAAPPAVNPQSGSIGLQGTVHGPAPSQAATITSPRNGDHTSSIPITVQGLCPAGTFVLITKNGAFAGATTCADDGTFSLQIDLFDGQNELVARVSDALGQFGPDSAGVSVFYDAPSVSLPGGVTGRQLFLDADITVVAVSPGQSVSRTVTIVGGVGPYAISWDWGDGSTSLMSQSGEGPVSASHTYAQPGNYQIVVRASDAAGNAAFLQLVTVVNGPVPAVGTNKGTGLGALPGTLLAAWPLLGLAIFFVAFFWLGERRELHKLRRQGKVIV